MKTTIESYKEEIEAGKVIPTTDTEGLRLYIIQQISHFKDILLELGSSVSGMADLLVTRHQETEYAVVYKSDIGLNLAMYFYPKWLADYYMLLASRADKHVCNECSHSSQPNSSSQQTGRKG